MMNGRMRKLPKTLWVVSALLLAACVHHPAPTGPWLLPRGKQSHDIQIFRGEPERLLFQFKSFARLSDHDAQVVALSPFGPTLFRVEDQAGSADFRFNDVSPLLQSRMGDVRRAYSRLRSLFWARRAEAPAELEIAGLDPDGQATRLNLRLHGFRIQIDVTKIAEATP